MTADGIAGIIVALGALVTAVAGLVAALKAGNKSDVNAAHIDNLSTTAEKHTDQIQAMALATPTVNPATVTISTGGVQTTPGGTGDASNL